MNEPFVGERGALMFGHATVPICGWALRFDPTRDAWSGSIAVAGPAAARDAIIRLADEERPGTQWTGRIRLTASAAWAKDEAARRWEFEGVGQLRRERVAA